MAEYGSYPNILDGEYMHIISFDPMKLQKDVVAKQPSPTLINNLLDLVENNFPGVTHIAVSIPLNADGDFAAHNVKPSPLTVADFTDLWIDAIHKRGWNVLIRGTFCETEKIYGFPLLVQTSDFWVAKALAWLDAYKAHLKGADIFAPFPELEGHIWDGTGACIADTGDQNKDYNVFYGKLIDAINAWGTTNKIGIYPMPTINRSEAINGWFHEDNVKKIGGFVIDYYGDSKTEAEMAGKIDELYNKYPTKYQVFQQEWGDTRDSATVAADPGFTAAMADEVFFPKLTAGELIGINFWNLFDTPQEGIVHIDGDSVSLNAKGQALARIFHTWFGGGTTPTTPPPPGSTTTQPTPPPSTTLQPKPPLPSFSVQGKVLMTSDGKGNITINISETI